MAAGAGRIPEPWGCSASQLQETPAPSAGVGLCHCCHLAPRLAWHSCLSTWPPLRLSSPAAAVVPGQQVKAATGPYLKGSLLGTASSSPGRGLQPQNHSCATAAWNCKPTRTRRLLWAAPVSTGCFPAQAAQETLGEGGLHIALGKKLRDQDA